MLHLCKWVVMKQLSSSESLRVSSHIKLTVHVNNLQYWNQTKCIYQVKRIFCHIKQATEKNGTKKPDGDM